MDRAVYPLVDDIWMLIQRSLIDLALTHRQGGISKAEWLQVQDMNLLLLSMRKINIVNGKAPAGQEAFVEKIDEWDRLAKRAVRVTTEACSGPSEISSLVDELSSFKRSLSSFVCGSAWHWIS